MSDTHIDKQVDLKDKHEAPCSCCGPAEAHSQEHEAQRSCCEPVHAHSGEGDSGHSHGGSCDHGDSEHSHGCGCCHGESEQEGGFFTPINIIGIALFAAGFVAEHFTVAVWWVPFTLLLAAYIIIGRPVLAMAGRNILHGKVFDENFLMCVASIGAFVIGEYPEAVAVMLFYMIGEHFQGKAVNHSRKSIRALMDIRPDTAWVVSNQSGAGQAGAEQANAEQADAEQANVEQVNAEQTQIWQGDAHEIAADDVAVRSIIEIKPGGRIPLDAVVVSGSGNIDMMALTGETLPVEVSPGSEILAGAVNGGSLLRARVTKPFAESTASKIIELAQNASERKAPAENFISRFARVYTPIVVAAAAGIAILPPIFGAGTWPDWIMRGLVFLVVSCPCALVISIPVSYFGGIGGASSKGILVKGGNYLDTLSRISAVVFDKTGTLTKGSFKVARIKPSGKFSERETLAYAAAAESASTHPIAVSIVESKRAYDNNNGAVSDSSPNMSFSAEGVMEKAGYGVSATVNGKRVVCGNAKYMSDIGIVHANPATHGTAVHIAVGGEYAGYIIVADEIKPDSATAIAELKARGIDRIIMLSGDAPEVAAEVGAALGINEVHAGLLPQQKVEILEKLMSQGDDSLDSSDIPHGAGEVFSGPVAVVGDGINDAPMLARADIGIAMGGLGSDAAVEAADVVIMNDAPSKIVTAVDVARKTKRVVIQNISLALGIKAVVLLLAALGIANMWEAVFADVGVALLAVLNAMRAGR